MSRSDNTPQSENDGKAQGEAVALAEILRRGGATRQPDVAVFARSFSGGGGAERVVLNLAAGFAAKGATVDLVMGRVEGRFVDEIPTGVRVVDLGVGSGWRGLADLSKLDRADALQLLPSFLSGDVPWILGGIRPLARYLAGVRPKVLLAALNYTNLTAILGEEIAGSGTPVVVSVHNHTSIALRESLRPRMRFLPRLMRHFFDRAGAIVAVSDGVADDLAALTGLPRERIARIYNPAVAADIGERAARPAGHAWLDEAGPPVLLGVGKFKPQKDFATLVRAFAQVRKDRPARLVILGDGPLETSAMDLARDLGVAADVDFPGFVDNPYAYMARSAVFALSSAWEGFGNVIPEAMACGTPVVSTDCPSGPAEILEGGRYGELVPVGDAEALAAAILRTLDAPLPAEKLRARAREFTAERSVDRYAALFDRLTGQGES